MSSLKIDKIYVLAINHTEEKYADIAKRLNELNLPGSIPFEVLPGHNGYTDPLPDGMAIYDGWAMETDNVYWSTPVTQGEVGCTISHINAWKRAVEEGHERVLILEEDFYGIKPVFELREPTVEWDFMYLGRYKFEGSVSEKIDSQWERPGLSYNMQAYVLTSKGAKTLVDYHLERNLFINDEFITATYSNHRRNDVEAMYPEKKIKAIATIEDYIGQSSNAETTLVSKHGYANMETNETLQKMEQFKILQTQDWQEWTSRYIAPVMLQKDFELMTDELGHNIIEFPLFTDDFCKELIELAEATGEWTIGRHEFYPTNDMLIQSLGLGPAYDRVINEFVAPVATWYWQLEGEGWDQMDHETFIIRYRPDRQGQLSVHHDHSHYTIGVKLNDEFEGGGTFFPKYGINAMPKRNGNVFMHPGMITHRHGGRPVYSGTRYIAVSFIKNSRIMN